MNQYAVLFDVKDDKIFYKSEQLTRESYEGARFLIADFIRNQHAERSGERIETEKSLHFPGDPIPDRIIRILKSICSCHTKDINEVMKLHSVESSGCGVDDCHPRFIAAMLRLGDLLDVDSNRISEVLLSTLGSIPSDSKYYNKTNRAITHIRIDKSIIEITAECDDYNVADLINRWFQWLNDELVFYMKQWHKIIPHESFGYLPTVGDLKVNLANYDTFDGKKRPSFDIDSSKAIELLQGAGLYSDSCECIRELMQNAVDATYLRLYKENPGINDLRKFKEKCEQYPIVVSLNRKNLSEINNKYTYWCVTIADEGIGMTKDDLRFLSTTGSSEKNAEKKQLINSVPDFLRPSGTFGIGFQSVFLITDKVSIITRKLNKDNYIEAEMHNPSGKEKGAILIRSVHKEDVKFGTTLRFDFMDENEGHQLRGYVDRHSMSAFNSFDFAKTKYISLIGMRVRDEIERFASGTFIPIRFIYEGKEMKSSLQKTKIKFDDIDLETGLQLCLDKSHTGAELHDYSMVYYRNQWVRNFHPHIPFITLHINILKGSAKDILSLNRNEIRREYKPLLRDNIKKTIIRYLNKKFDTFDNVTKQLASMYLEFHKDFILNNNIENISFRENWQQYELVVNKKDSDQKEKLSIEKLLQASSIELINKETEADQLIFDFTDAKYTLTFDYNYRQIRICYFLLRRASLTFHLQFIEGGFILYKDTDCDLIKDSKEAKEDLMYNYLRTDERARGLIPCNQKYEVLQVDRQRLGKYVNIEGYIEYPCMICPYIRKYDLEHADEAICLEYDVDKKVINTTYEHRVDVNVTKKQIEDAYEDFKNEWKLIVEKVNSKAKKESLDSDLFRPRTFRVYI